MAKNCRWILKEAADAEKVGRLATEVGIDKVLADLLVKRGVNSFEEARAFFRPSLKDLHDPFLMKDMASHIKALIGLQRADSRSSSHSTAASRPLTRSPMPEAKGWI